VSECVDIAGELEQHRTCLTCIARRQLRDEHLVEDVVQETLLAALTSSFSGASSVRTWLVAILKHKMVDAIRKRQRQPELLASQRRARPDPGVEDFESLFDESSSSANQLLSWGDPEQTLRQREFFDVVASCVQTLSSRTARAFMMREYMQLEVSEIGSELCITEGNVHVILFRGRTALRRCLERRWFEAGPRRRLPDPAVDGEDPGPDTSRKSV